MTKLQRLQNEALQSCNRRGHTMYNFKRFDATCSSSRCVKCGMYVAVNTKPMPNEIDIGGEALAINCTWIAQ